MWRRLAILAALLALAPAGCGGDDDDSGDEPAQTNTTEQPAANTGPSKSDAVAKVNLEKAIGFYNQGFEVFQARFRRATKTGDFEAFQAAVSDYRDVFYEFDRRLRAINFDDSLVPQVNSILEQNRDLIAKLDAIGNTSDFSEAAPLYAAFLKDRATIVKAVNRLHDQM